MRGVGLLPKWPFLDVCRAVEWWEEMFSINMRTLDGTTWLVLRWMAVSMHGRRPATAFKQQAFTGGEMPLKAHWIGLEQPWKRGIARLRKEKYHTELLVRWSVDCNPAGDDPTAFRRLHCTLHEFGTSLQEAEHHIIETSGCIAEGS